MPSFSASANSNHRFLHPNSPQLNSTQSQLSHFNSNSSFTNPSLSPLLEMAQVVATRSIHSSQLANPSSTALHSQFHSLRPSSFASKLLIPRRNGNSAVRASFSVSARRSARAEPEVVPVTPADVPKVPALHISLHVLHDTRIGLASFRYYVFVFLCTNMIVYIF